MDKSGLYDCCQQKTQIIKYEFTQYFLQFLLRFLI
jgi:hypothetical protein